MTTTTDDARAFEVGAWNPVTDQPYHGANIDRLATAAVEHGYNVERGWAGFRQWRTLGRTVKRGEHGATIFHHVTDKHADDTEHDAKERRYNRNGYSVRVFHYDQTTELTEKEAER